MGENPTNSILVSSLVISDEDQRLIHVIAKRAARLMGVDILTCEMDLATVHANGNPLRLHEMAVADGYDFAHDIGGIMKNLDRKTGRLTNFFDPRFTDYEALKMTPLPAEV
jgi:hypothetical protein